MAARNLAAEKYINRIRNRPKQAYARAWYTYCLGLNELPERATYAPLSYMGAQAVRIRLDADFGIRPEGCLICGRERPEGYSLTCGRSECQEAQHRGYDGPAGGNREDI